MNYSYPIVIFLMLFAFSCDKEDPAPIQTAEEIVKEEISEALASHSDLTEFTTAFQNINLKAEDVQTGLTVFAPQDASSGGRTKADNNASALTPEILKGHMVKGLVHATALSDGDTFEALDGKKLVVSVNGTEIRINGVLISGKDLVQEAKYIIHKVEKIIEAVKEGGEEPEPVSVTVTVMNSTRWTPETPRGEPEAGATVAFYLSQEAYAAGNAIFEGVTDLEGKITFTEAVAGNDYYIVAQKGELSNAHNVSFDPVDSVYLGWISDGLFMSQEEIDSHAIQPGAAPGNFKWRDLNGDGMINNEDRGFIPDQKVTAIAGAVANAEVIIGYENNDAMIVKDGPDALKTLQAARTMINSMHKTLVMTDGILSDDAPCPELTDWCTIDNFSFTDSNPTVLKIWNEAYNAIGELNLLLRDVPSLTFADKDMVLNQAIGLRAYVYLELVKYFGGIPIPELRIKDTDSRATTEEVYALVMAGLESVVDRQPAMPSEERYLLTADAARVLIARVALLQRDYARASDFAGQVINGMRHQLAGTTDEAFISTTNAEIIWDFSSSLPAGFQDYFYGRTFSPAIRLAEVYLVLAEAQLELFSLEESRANVNVIRSRMGMPVAEGLTPDDLRLELRETWRVEMSREGNRFVNLVRWNIAESVLSGNGYTNGKHSLLPIPRAVLDKNFNIYQNPGY